MTATLRTRVREVLTWLERHGSKRQREDMAKRYSIHAPKSFGVPVGAIQQLAKRLGRDHELAAALGRHGRAQLRPKGRELGAASDRRAEREAERRGARDGTAAGGIGRRRGAVGGKGCSEAAGESGGAKAPRGPQGEERGSALSQEPTDLFHQRDRLEGLLKECRARPAALRKDGPFVVPGHEEHAKPGPIAQKHVRHLPAVHRVQAEIGHQQVNGGFVVGGKLDRIDGRVRGANRVARPLEHFAQAGTDGRVVLQHEDARARGITG